MSDDVKNKPSVKRKRPGPENRPGPKPSDEPNEIGGDEEMSAEHEAAEVPTADLPEPEEAKSSDFKTLPPPSKDMSRKQLTEQYQPYVRSIAGKIKKTLSKEIEFDDLVQYGMLG